jgi:hypothetical protein
MIGDHPSTRKAPAAAVPPRGSRWDVPRPRRVVVLRGRAQRTKKPAPLQGGPSALPCSPLRSYAWSADAKGLKRRPFANPGSDAAAEHLGFQLSLADQIRPNETCAFLFGPKPLTVIMAMFIRPISKPAGFHRFTSLRRESRSSTKLRRIEIPTTRARSPDQGHHLFPTSPQAARPRRPPKTPHHAQGPTQRPSKLLRDRNYRCVAIRLPPSLPTPARGPGRAETRREFSQRTQAASSRPPTTLLSTPKLYPPSSAPSVFSVLNPPWPTSAPAPPAHTPPSSPPR